MVRACDTPPQDKARNLDYKQAMNDKADIILGAVLRQVPFEGWTSRAVSAAMATLDLPGGSEHIYAPAGALGLIGTWSAQMDAQMITQIEGFDLETMRIRDKVTEAVWARLNVLAGHEEAARRALARLTLPDAAGRGAAQLWATADAIWTAIGDTSEDYNYYTKRTILSGVIGSSLMSWLSDDTDDKSTARAFLERRIGNVMQFEKFKGQTLTALSGLPKPSEFTNLFKPSGFKRRRPYRAYPRQKS